jgi:hypothetical protein
MNGWNLLTYSHEPSGTDKDLLNSPEEEKDLLFFYFIQKIYFSDLGCGAG